MIRNFYNFIRQILRFISKYLKFLYKTSKKKVNIPELQNKTVACENIHGTFRQEKHVSLYIYLSIEKLCYTDIHI